MSIPQIVLNNDILMEEIQKFVASVLNTKIIDYVIVSFQTLIALDS